MSLYDYEKSCELQALPFYALIMAAMRKADDKNLRKLKDAWPEEWAELQARYNAPGGLLPEERQAAKAPTMTDLMVTPETLEDDCDCPMCRTLADD